MPTPQFGSESEVDHRHCSHSLLPGKAGPKPVNVLLGTITRITNRTS